MPPLPVINAKVFIRALQQVGFEVTKQKGSHCTLRHSDGRRAIIPNHGTKDIPRGTLKSILRDIGLDNEAFIKILEK